jgi:RimJ/RimL family protein N-acetyltransferase
MDENLNIDAGFPISGAYAVGRTIYFRYPTNADAIGRWHHWFNSPDVTRNLVAQYWPNTPEDQLAYLQEVRKSRQRLLLAIIDRASGTHIGVGSLGSIDHVNRRAEVSLIIGEPSFRDGFRALECLSMLTEIGLAKLNLNKLVATSLDISTAGLQLDSLLGYRECGRWHEHAFVEGKFADCVLLEMFQRDWLVSAKRPKSLYLVD